MAQPVRFVVNYTLELLTAGAMALGSFVFLFLLLNYIFPMGPGLSALMSTNDISLNNNSSVNRSLWVTNSEEKNGLNEKISHVATLSDIKNNVKNKPIDQLVWKTAKKGLTLYGGDSIQTFDSSKATITFNEGNAIELGENSLIVINRLEEDIIWREKKSFMSMMEGTVRGKLTNHKKKPVYIEITMPNSVAAIRSNEVVDEVDFQIKVNPNNSSVVTVFKGEAEISTNEGKKVNITENRASLITKKGGVSVPELLPEAPILKTPVNKEAFYFSDIPPAVTFRWFKSNHSENYKFILSKDKLFTQIIYEKRVKSTQFEYKNLKHGTYYWKIIGIGKNRAEGEDSKFRTIKVIQDSKPPVLNVKFSKPIQGKSSYTLQGKTEPSATIYINGKKVNNPKGEFKHTIKLKRGPNIIVVESVDKLGNVSYKSETIHGKF